MCRHSPFILALCALASLIVLPEVALPREALAKEITCDGVWRSVADQQAAIGLQTFQSSAVAGRVAFWRRVALDENMPTDISNSGSHYGAWRWHDDNDYVELGRKLGAEVDGQRWKHPRQIYLYSNDLLRERVRLLGEQHPYVREWVANQNVVYRNERDVPVRLPTLEGTYDVATNALAQDDIAYQQAAAHYYAASFGEALTHFQTIADSPSRHRDIAAYMVAKTLAAEQRYAEALAKVDAIRADPGRRAVHLMAGELYGFIRSEMRTSFVTDNDPVYATARERALAFDADLIGASTVEIEADPEMKAAFWQALENLPFYLRSDLGRHTPGREMVDDWWLDDDNPLSMGFAVAARGHEVLDWLQAAQSVDGLITAPGPVYQAERTASRGFLRMEAHIEERIQTGHATAWEVLRLARQPYRPTLGSAISTAQADFDNCNATEQQQWIVGAVQYHLRRLTFMSNSSWMRRERLAGKWWLAENAARPEDLLPVEQRLYFFGSQTGGRPKKAALASINLVELADIFGSNDMPDDVMAVGNVMPLADIEAFLALKRVPTEYKSMIIRMAWTRAYLLQQTDLVERFTPLLAALNPELAPFVTKIESAKTEAGRSHAALNMLLSVPAMNMRISLGPDARTMRYPNAWQQAAITMTDGHNPNDANWWCRFDVLQETAALRRYFFDVPVGLAPNLRARYDRFNDVAASSASFSNEMRAGWEDEREVVLDHHPLLQQIDWQELGALSKIEAAPTYLGKQAIAWAKDASWFDRWWEGDEIADALALTVRATRWGCTRDGSDAEISRRAYVLLHQLFPDSEAAARTRYWYN